MKLNRSKLKEIIKDEIDKQLMESREYAKAKVTVSHKILSPLEDFVDKAIGRMMAYEDQNPIDGGTTFVYNPLVTKGTVVFDG